jgi:hypothetical protein
MLLLEVISGEVASDPGHVGSLGLYPGPSVSALFVIVTDFGSLEPS